MIFKSFAYFLKALEIGELIFWSHHWKEDASARGFSIADLLNDNDLPIEAPRCVIEITMGFQDVFHLKWSNVHLEPIWESEMFVSLTCYIMLLRSFAPKVMMLEPQVMRWVESMVHVWNAKDLDEDADAGATLDDEGETLVPRSQNLRDKSCIIYIRYIQNTIFIYLRFFTRTNHGIFVPFACKQFGSSACNAFCSQFASGQVSGPLRLSDFSHGHAGSSQKGSQN